MRKFIVYWLGICFVVSSSFASLSRYCEPAFDPRENMTPGLFPFVKQGIAFDPYQFRIDNATFIKYIRETKNLDTKDSSGWAPIHYATNNRSFSAVHDLLERGANPNILTFEEFGRGEAPLHFIARMSRPDMATLLMKYPVDINIQTQDFKMTPLQIAAKEGVPEVVRILLQNGADHSLKDSMDWTALDHAISRKRWENVIVLLEAGAEPNRNPDGRTSFDRAVSNGDNRSARLLSKDTKDYWQQMWRYLRRL